jgi:hypothetical protein
MRLFTIHASFIKPAKHFHAPQPSPNSQPPFSRLLPISVLLVPRASKGVDPIPLALVFLKKVTTFRETVKMLYYCQGERQ